MKHLLSLTMLVALVAVACPALPGHAQGNPPSFRPDAGLARLEYAHGKIHVRVDRATGTVRLIEGNLGQGTRGDEQRLARRFFDSYGDVFGLTDPTVELALQTINRDGRGYASVRFAQRYAGIEVHGGDIRADVDGNGQLHSVHGALVPFPRPQSVRPALSDTEALQRARGIVGGNVIGQPRLIIARHGATDHLAWQVLLRTPSPALWRFEIDADNGAVLDRQQLLQANKDIQTYDAVNSFDLPGVLVRQTPGSPVADGDVNAAHENAERVYDYYRAMFGRDSLDSFGMTIVSTVHYGQNYNNAFWDPGNLQVVYGDGDGNVFGPLGRALDVVAHELTHGVTQFTAQLAYAGQSGALNESFSDIFGALIDSSNWELAEKVYTPTVPGDALRSLAEPTRYGQPGSWGEYIVLPNTYGGDYGGVHLNSGIFNHVAYTIARQLGREKLAQIAYRTLTMKLTSTSDFIAARDLTTQACDELVTPTIVPAITAADCHAVRQAFTMAGWDDVPATGTFRQVYLPTVVNGAAVCSPNAIRNGDFEDGELAWSNTGRVYGSVVDRWPRVRSGARSAKIAGNAQLLQLVRHRVGASVRLTFDVYKDGGTADDTLLVGWEDPRTYVELRTPTTVSMPAGRWTTITLLVPELAPNDSFRLIFRHGSGNADIYIDNISIEQNC